MRKLKSWQIGFVLTGVLIVLSGIFAFSLGLSESTGFSAGKALICLSGVALVAIGLLGSRTRDIYKTIALISLNTIVLIIALEMGLFVWARVNDFVNPPKPVSDALHTKYVDDGREKLPYYQEQEWSKRYWREYHAAWTTRDLSFEPYLIWRNSAFEGETLNIDEDGLRFVPGSVCTEDSFKVFTFGGSTMWGTGVPDWGTIPAFLQAKLSKREDRPVCVVDYSEQAWVSTQSVVQLAFVLKEGSRPDLVIFYDGNNDIFAAYQSGMAGLPQNFSTLAARFEDRPEVSPIIPLLSQTRIYSALQRLLLGADFDQIPIYERHGVSVDELATEVSQTYFDNIAFVNTLAREYHFDVHSFWQTTLVVDGKQLTEEEQAIKAVANSVFPGLAELYSKTTQMVGEQSGDDNMHIITDVFENETDLVFIDLMHVTIEGNQLVAEAMLSVIGK